jgi:hypothetical protein
MNSGDMPKNVKLEGLLNETYLNLRHHRIALKGPEENHYKPQ